MPSTPKSAQSLPLAHTVLFSPVTEAAPDTPLTHGSSCVRRVSLSGVCALLHTEDMLLLNNGALVEYELSKETALAPGLDPQNQAAQASAL